MNTLGRLALIYSLFGLKIAIIDFFLLQYETSSCIDNNFLHGENLEVIAGTQGLSY
jgi:hypothetical protein